MDVNALVQNAGATLVSVAWKVVGAVIIWIAGRWLISVLRSARLGRALARQTVRRHALTLHPTPRSASS